MFKRNYFISALIFKGGEITLAHRVAYYISFRAPDAGYICNEWREILAEENNVNSEQVVILSLNKV